MTAHKNCVREAEWAFWGIDFPPLSQLHLQICMASPNCQCQCQCHPKPNSTHPTPTTPILSSSSSHLPRLDNTNPSSPSDPESPKFPPLLPCDEPCPSAVPKIQPPTAARHMCPRFSNSHRVGSRWIPRKLRPGDPQPVIGCRPSELPTLDSIGGGCESNIRSCCGN